MRSAALAVAVVSAILLAGCGGKGPGTSGDPTPSCPRWTPGLSTWRGTFVFDANHTTVPMSDDTFPQSARDLVDEGRQLDRIYLEFDPKQGSSMTVRDARLEMRFYRGDDGTPLRGYHLGQGVPEKSNQGQVMFSFGPGTHVNFTIMVPLTPSDQPAKPTPMRIELTFIPDLDGNPVTSSRVDFKGLGKYSYRAC